MRCGVVTLFSDCLGGAGVVGVLFGTAERCDVLPFRGWLAAELVGGGFGGLVVTSGLGKSFVERPRRFLKRKPGHS